MKASHEWYLGLARAEAQNGNRLLPRTTTNTLNTTSGK